MQFEDYVMYDSCFEMQKLQVASSHTEVVDASGGFNVKAFCATTRDYMDTLLTVAFLRTSMPVR